MLKTRHFIKRALTVFVVVATLCCVYVVEPQFDPTAPEPIRGENTPKVQTFNV